MTEFIKEKKEYVEPEIDFSLFSAEDILTLSGELGQGPVSGEDEGYSPWI